jgi:hypothetical protein
VEKGTSQLEELMYGSRGNLGCQHEHYSLNVHSRYGSQPMLDRMLLVCLDFEVFSYTEADRISGALVGCASELWNERLVHTAPFGVSRSRS